MINAPTTFSWAELPFHPYEGFMGGAADTAVPDPRSVELDVVDGTPVDSATRWLFEPDEGRFGEDLCAGWLWAAGDARDERRCGNMGSILEDQVPEVRSQTAFAR